MPAARPVYVDVDDRQNDHRVDAVHLANVLAAALHDRHLARGLSPRTTRDASAAQAEVGLAFVGVDEMTELNSQYMSGEGPTDVLAFPIDGLTDADAVPSGQPVMFGDVIICPAIASRAPQELGDELALLVVHGALHLLGHDHREPSETVEMKALETELLDRYHRIDHAPSTSDP